MPSAPLHLGQGLPGEELTATFPLMNRGNAPLSIEKVEAGCACSSLDLSRKTIPPGEEAVLKVAVHLRADAKDLSFPIRIFSNDPSAPETVVMARAEVVPPPVRTDPDTLNFAQVPAGTSPVQVLNLLKPDGTPWLTAETLKVTPEKSLVQVDTRQVKTDSVQAAQVVVSLRPDLPLGSFADVLTIQAAGSERVFSVPIQGMVVPPLEASPTGLYFGDVVPRSTPITRSLMLRRRDGKPLTRIVKSTTPPGIRIDEEAAAETKPTKDTKRILVVLEPSAVVQDVKNGQLALWLEGEAEPIIVRVMIYLRK
jgi:hypothetical protein